LTEASSSRLRRGTRSVPSARDDRADLDYFYEEYPEVAQAFNDELDKAVDPRRPGLLYDLVRDFGLPPDSRVVDVGCGRGKHSFRLAQRFRFNVLGVDPMLRHIEAAKASFKAHPGLEERVRFVLGSAEALPVNDERADLVWCHGSLVHVADLEQAFGEIRRVLRPGGRVLVYQKFRTQHLEPQEAEWLFRMMQIVPTSSGARHMEDTIATHGLRIDDVLTLGGEVEESPEDRDQRYGKLLIHASRLLRDPQRYISQFGQATYDTTLGRRLYQIYGMIGKLEFRVYLLTKREDGV
jgi:SAM-dependent methyltransferase